VHPGRNGVRVWPVFESAELGHTIDKASFDAELPKLRQALLAAQYRLLEAKRFPVIVLINGVDGAGKGETVNALNAWMDPRHIRSHAFGAASDEERERPAMWRFWRALAPSGRIGIMFGNWYTAPIVDRALGHSKKAQLAQSLSTIEHFERMLTDEGALLLKFWFHLSKDRQKKRLKELEKDKRTRWRVTDHDWENFERYDAFRDVSAHVLRETSSGAAPWIIVDGSDSRYRSLTVGRALLDAMTARLDAPAGSHERQTPREAPTFPADQQTNVLRALDMTQKVEKKTYERDLEHYQGKLNLLCREPKFQQHSLVAVFEGADAAGKGGAIRRVTVALDARQYAVIPVAAPTEEERVQPGCWSSASRASAPSETGCAPTPRSTTSRSSSSSTASWSRSSGCRSPRKSSCGASRSARASSSSSTRSPRKTGATARSGTPTSAPSATWSIAPAPTSPPGRWWPPRTNTTPACPS
jgi:AMP-polyphosphate phosphotransferase